MTTETEQANGRTVADDIARKPIRVSLCSLAEGGAQEFIIPLMDNAFDSLKWGEDFAATFKEIIALQGRVDGAEGVSTSDMLNMMGAFPRQFVDLFFSYWGKGSDARDTILKQSTMTEISAAVMEVIQVASPLALLMPSARTASEE